MKTTVVVIGLLVSATAYAQTQPPMVGDKPLMQVAPKRSKAAAAKQQPISVASKLQACLEIEDESKERLDCYDAVIVPKPTTGKRKVPPPKAVTDCRAVREQDERLTCFNGFVARLPKT